MLIEASAKGINYAFLSLRAKPKVKRGSPKIIISVAAEEIKTPLKKLQKATKKYQVFQLGERGDIHLEEAARQLDCSVNMIKMHLRYLNERDGYGYTIYDNSIFKIF